MELRDLYNNKKILTGKTIEKGQDVPKGYYYITVVVFMENSKGEFLLQKRSLRKGGEWATTGGHPKSGESSLQGMVTEIKEELGLDIKQNELTLFKTIMTEDDFVDLYYLKKDINIEDITIQEEELTDVKYATIQEIDKLFSEKNFKKGHYMMFQDCLEWLEK